MERLDTESRSALRTIIHRYQFAFFVLVIFLAGGTFIVGVEFFGWPGPLGDLGVAFLAAGAVGLGLEYYTRSQFNELVKDSVVEAVNATNLERRITELAADASLGEHFRRAGLRKIHATRRTIPFREYLEGAPAGAEIAFLGICLRGFLDEESQTILIQKAEDGCNIRMLVIDPESRYVSQRAAIENRKDDDVKSDIDAASRLHLNLLRSKMPLECSDRFSIRYYDAPVNLFLFKANDRGVLGFYLDGNRGEFFPKLSLIARMGYWLLLSMSTLSRFGTRLGTCTTMAEITLSNEEWLRLEEVARTAVSMGGIAAMGYYHEALAPMAPLDQSRNPSTEADVQATAAILRSLDSGIAEAVQGRFGQKYFAEELTAPTGRGGSERQRRMNEVVASLGAVTHCVARTRQDFIDAFPTAICALIDGVDGTTSFRAGIPLFCCAVALFIQGEPRIGAIYDPIHHTVYYGSIRSKTTRGQESEGVSSIWQIRSGSHARLPLRAGRSAERLLVGTHLTRSSPAAFREAAGMLSRVANKTNGVYMLNCGQLALAYVASGSLSAFYNNYTNVWDTAAGEVLVRAAGGLVTSFDGKSIDYSDQSEGARKVKVIAALDNRVHRMIQDLVQ